MTINDIPLLITSCVFFIIGIGLLVYWAKLGGYFSFLRNSHYYALALFLVAGILTWLGMVYVVNPDKLEVSPKQWMALGFSIGISVLWWARYIFSISPNTELVESEE